jgi:hypothetical protein
MALTARRRLAVAGLAIGLVAAACGGPAQPTVSPGSHPVGSGADAARPLAAGLAANLNNLTSYRFVASNGGSPGGGSYSIAGLVVNSPVPSVSIKQAGAQFIVIGGAAWTSIDGKSWMAIDPQAVGATDVLPGKEYGSWFDAKASYFEVVGDETRNNVPCTHYHGNSALSSMYAGLAGGTSVAEFRADVWIAKDGNYPVSGVFGLSAPTSGAGGSGSGSGSGGWGFQFDITDVNAATNGLVQPTNVVAYPT